MELFRAMLSTTSTRPLRYFLVNVVDVADVVDAENSAKNQTKHKIKTIQLLLLYYKTIQLFRSMFSVDVVSHIDSADAVFRRRCGRCGIL